ncbi:hypothetical protein AAFF_G00416880 [Aldrovandia affinis]|uniref:Uncharacterized protein n=1 Tax=Aldrovandia affinis TaxID=143900 RepID=A0AAD7SCX7_9TELE|nr:hypothetical protein AAFF_G00416880 [Aldrovandia affinis]
MEIFKVPEFLWQGLCPAEGVSLGAGVRRKKGSQNKGSRLGPSPGRSSARLCKLSQALRMSRDGIDFLLYAARRGGVEPLRERQAEDPEALGHWSCDPASLSAENPPRAAAIILSAPVKVGARIGARAGLCKHGAGHGHGSLAPQGGMPLPAPGPRSGPALPNLSAPSCQDPNKRGSPAAV